MTTFTRRTQDIPTQIKNPELVTRRRRQIADAAVRLFITNGFDKTTTRQIARASRLSIGSLYEYFATKEDILYLVLDSIYFEIEKALNRALSSSAKGEAALAELIRQYFFACHKSTDDMLLLYQETHALPRAWRRRVLKSEKDITHIFKKAIQEIFSQDKSFNVDNSRVTVIAHDIGVMAHMWSFRRWALGRECSIEKYIEIQTDLVLTYIEKIKKEITNGA